MAIVISLLAVLGIVVGGATELALRDSLYDQLDGKLDDAAMGTRIYFEHYDDVFPGPGGQLRTRFRPPGALDDPILFQVFADGRTRGGKITDQGPFDSHTTLLTAAQQKALVGSAPENGKVTLQIPGLGSYRIIATTDSSGTRTITGLSLSDTNGILVRAALGTGTVVLLALLTAGFVGAIIIRRTLRPLGRVAATATRVAELELDRGEVDLAQRVPAVDTDPRTEVGQVGAALNRLLDHVGNALEARHASETQVRQFVADASHELRTPLAAIRGYAELSRRTRQPVPAEVAHVLNRVESEATRMTALVEDLLLLARLDAGRPLAHDPVDLSMLVVDAVSDAHAAGPRHDWQLDLPDDPVKVIGDGARLHQVLANLLANARTHTPEGTRVTVAVSVTGARAQLRVTDTGPGIPAALLPTIFERFARGDSSRSRAAGSTGLGLSIVSAVVSAHGGTVTVDSEPGFTQFTVALPAAGV